MANDRDAAEANLALLIRDANAATTAQEKASASEALENFAEKTQFGELRTRADESLAILAAATRQAAIKGMRDQLEQIHSLDEAFKSAERVAADGEKHLFFPRVASALGQVESLLSSLKEQFDNLGADVNNLKGGIDLPKLKALASSVQGAASVLTQKLQGL